MGSRLLLILEPEADSTSYSHNRNSIEEALANCRVQKSSFNLMLRSEMSLLAPGSTLLNRDEVSLPRPPFEMCCFIREFEK